MMAVVWLFVYQSQDDIRTDETELKCKRNYWREFDLLKQPKIRKDAILSRFY